MPNLQCKEHNLRLFPPFLVDIIFHLKLGEETRLSGLTEADALFLDNCYHAARHHLDLLNYNFQSSYELTHIKDVLCNKPHAALA